MRSPRLTLALTLALSSACWASPGRDAGRWVGPEKLGTIQYPQVVEASGLMASSNRPDTWWTLNDSGGSASLYAFSSDGRRQGAINLVDARNIDWEALTGGSQFGRPILIIGEIGNGLPDPSRDTRLYLIEEPTPEKLGPDATASMFVLRTIAFRYPDGARDAEAMAYAADENAVYILSKRDTPPRLYRVKLLGMGPLVAEFLTDVPGIPPPSAVQRFLPVPAGRFRSQPTDMAFSPDGRWAAVLTYGEVWMFARHPGMSWDDTLAGRPTKLPPHNLFQAEALAFAPDGQSIVVTTEGKFSELLRYRLEAPVSAP